MRRNNRLFYGLIIFLIIGGLYVFSSTEEGFANPFEKVIKKLKEAQQGGLAYYQWVGYLYKNPAKNSDILNDYKSRVFQPDCRFRDNWATKLPPGMIIPLSANSKDLASIAYKKYFEALSKGEGGTGEQLINSLKRFMAPGCALLNDPSQYRRPFNVSFK